MPAGLPTKEEVCCGEGGNYPCTRPVGDLFVSGPTYRPSRVTLLEGQKTDKTATLTARVGLSYHLLGGRRLTGVWADRAAPRQVCLVSSLPSKSAAP